MDIRYLVISSAEEFQRLKKDWEKLNQLCPKGCFFTSWYWMFEWWSVYSKTTDDLFLVCAYGGEDLLGIAPFYVKRVGKYGLFRELRFIGTGESEEKEVATEYLDLIFHPDYEPRVVDGLIRTLLLEGRWHKGVLDNILASSAIRFKLDSGGYVAKLVEERCGVRYQVKLPNNYDDYLKNISSSNVRSKIRRSRKRFEKDLSGQVLYAENDAEVGEVMGQLKALHCRHWNEKGKLGAFISDEFVNFHQSIANYCFDMKSLVLMKMVVAGQTIAVFYGWQYKGTVSYYQSGIDTRFKPNVSPGYVMHSKVIEDSIQNGMKLYDFMKGGAQSYKSKFECETEAMVKVTLFNNTPKGKLLFGGESLIKSIKAVVKKMASSI